MAKKNTTNNTLLVVALLFFLVGFFISSTNISGEYTYRGTRGCVLGDINSDGIIGNEDDFSKIDNIVNGPLSPIPCADLNKDGVVDQEDINILFEVAAPVVAARNQRGRYCFDECNLGEKVCTAEGKFSKQSGRVIAQSEGNIYKVCGNFDEDPCTEWSPETMACGSGMRCRIKYPGTDICENLNLPEENVLQGRPSY